MATKPHVICLLGATAVGKTALALELVQRYPFQIISVDSAQIYRGLDIGTGKPTRDILDIAPHRLIDIRDPAEIYSASNFRLDAIAAINEVLALGQTPLLVGGTMMYFKVLRDGLANMPHADAQVRSDIEKLAQEQGWEAVHQQLAEVDPESAQRIHRNDPQRLQRALEVFLVSGKTMTELHQVQAQQEQRAPELDSNQALPFELHFMAIQPQDRQLLHGQIERRFMQMLQQGLVEEVEALHRRKDLNSSLPSIKSVGYRQVWQYLDGDLSYDGMVEKSIIATRGLAKRQLTWLRSWENLHCLGASADASSSSDKSSSDNSSGGKSIGFFADEVLKYMDSISI